MKKECDVLIVGAGGGGLTSAIYLARADFKTIVVEKNACGGQIAITDCVENFPGFPEGISGVEISSLMETQAKKSGAIIDFDQINKIKKEDDCFLLQGEINEYVAKAIVIASGACARRIGLESEEKFIGRGVSYCAVCDAPFFRNKIVAVIGGGDAAVQEAIYLTKFAEKVYLIHRRDQLRAGVALRKKAQQNEKIEFVWNSVVDNIEGKNIVESLIVRDVFSGDLREITLNGVFVFIGHNPVSAYLPETINKNSDGYILTDNNFQTSLKGVFACGEVRDGAVWQLIAACGEGCRAALSVQHYLENNS